MTFAYKMEDKLPKLLRNTMTDILEDNIIVNWRIYGGNQTTVCIKFEKTLADDNTAREDSAMHGWPSPPQYYKRKSLSSVERDMNRRVAWQQSISSGGIAVTGSKGYLTSDNDLETEHDTLKEFVDIPGSNCLFNNGSAQDSGFINSTKLNDEINISSGNSCTQVDSSSQTHTINSCGAVQTDDYHQSTHVQTDTPCVRNRRIQTVMPNHKALQTVQPRVHTMNKGVQLLPTKSHTTSQTTSHPKVQHNVATSTRGYIQLSKLTQTDPAISRHVQTVIPPNKDTAVLALEAYNKTSQTENKKMRKQHAKESKDTGIILNGNVTMNQCEMTEHEESSATDTQTSDGIDTTTLQHISEMITNLRNTFVDTSTSISTGVVHFGQNATPIITDDKDASPNG